MRASVGVQPLILNAMQKQGFGTHARLSLTTRTLQRP